MKNQKKIAKYQKLRKKLGYYKQDVTITICAY